MNLRVKPTVQPFTPLTTRNLLQIGSVSVVPHNSHENLQLTPTPNGPMRMQLIAHLETAGVELSDTFQFRKHRPEESHQSRARDPERTRHRSEKTGTVCEISSVQIDGAAHIVELTLNPGLTGLAPFASLSGRLSTPLPRNSPEACRPRRASASLLCPEISRNFFELLVIAADIDLVIGEFHAHRDSPSRPRSMGIPV